MTLIIGSEGSMGKRYQAILKFLGEPFGCYDLKTHGFLKLCDQYSRYIIATPTHTHLEWVARLDEYLKPILCEKPLSKDLVEVKEILKCKSPLSMMMQYTWLFDRHSFGRSFYDYYNHGPDGLIWDCFQIIALASGEIELKESSPVWSCRINGTKIQRQAMDAAYVEFVRAWLKGEAVVTRDQLLKWHEKVKQFEEKWITNQSA